MLSLARRHMDAGARRHVVTGARRHMDAGARHHVVTGARRHMDAGTTCDKNRSTENTTIGTTTPSLISDGDCHISQLVTQLW